jgi:hypothetical protein
LKAAVILLSEARAFRFSTRVDCFKLASDRVTLTKSNHGVCLKSINMQTPGRLGGF